MRSLTLASKGIAAAAAAAAVVVVAVAAVMVDLETADTADTAASLCVRRNSHATRGCDLTSMSFSVVDVGGLQCGSGRCARGRCGDEFQFLN